MPRGHVHAPNSDVLASPPYWVGYSENVANGKSFQVYVVYLLIFFKEQPKNEFSKQINRITMVNTLLFSNFK